MVEGEGPGEPHVEPALEPTQAQAPQPAPAQPIEPARVQAFELPTARHVVGSGLALAVASTRELRRASIYIGLLVLGAFGPSILAAMLILGRLGDGALERLASVFAADLGTPRDPALEGALLVVLFVALVGLLLFVSISIDAQVIAIALLGGRATHRPLRLWEAIVRARQAFWRMAGAGTLVGVIAFIVQSLIIAVLGGFSRSDQATSIAAALVATLLTAPLAYVSTSIVLGDVGAMEALSRSWRLFQARRPLAVVVTLFTLVASAIQLFAFSAGIDLVSRIADFLHLSLAEGAVAFTTAAMLILAGVVAYGSLTFTISAVVAAPQVMGFLGLTFFSGGLDIARSDAPRPPRGFRYVTRAMLGGFVVLVAMVAAALPAINSI